MKDIPLTTGEAFIKPMKLFLYGPSYSGKTYGAVAIAKGIVMSIRNCTEEEALNHIMLIDSEYGRGLLTQKELGKYLYYRIDAPYWTHKLVEAINILERKDQIDVIICDSLTHYWSKKGGILDLKMQADKQGGNSYTNWQEYTNHFNDMIDTILQSPKHIIATARSKDDVVLEPVTKKGVTKMVPTKYGLKPELREGIEYDFDISFNIDKTSHDLLRDKGVPGMDPIYPAATPDLGVKLLDLFNADKIAPKRTKKNVIDSLRRLAKEHNEVSFMMLQLSGRKIDTLEFNELVDLENKLLAEIKKKQMKKGKNS